MTLTRSLDPNFQEPPQSSISVSSKRVETTTTTTTTTTAAAAAVVVARRRIDPVEEEDEAEEEDDEELRNAQTHFLKRKSQYPSATMTLSSTRGGEINNTMQNTTNSMQVSASAIFKPARTLQHSMSKKSSGVSVVSNEVTMPPPTTMAKTANTKTPALKPHLNASDSEEEEESNRKKEELKGLQKQQSQQKKQTTTITEDVPKRKRGRPPLNKRGVKKRDTTEEDEPAPKKKSQMPPTPEAIVETQPTATPEVTASTTKVTSDKSSRLLRNSPKPTTSRNQLLSSMWNKTASKTPVATTSAAASASPSTSAAAAAAAKKPTTSASTIQQHVYDEPDHIDMDENEPLAKPKFSKKADKKKELSLLKKKMDKVNIFVQYGFNFIFIDF